MGKRLISLLFIVVHSVDIFSQNVPHPGKETGEAATSGNPLAMGIILISIILLIVLAIVLNYFVDSHFGKTEGE